MSCEVWKIKGENQIGERNKEKKCLQTHTTEPCLHRKNFRKPSI